MYLCGMKLNEYNAVKEYLRELIKDTEFNNKVFCVGGCCRDAILGDDIKDIDIVIELPNGGVHFAEWLRDNEHTKGAIVTYPTYGTSKFTLDKFPHIEIEAVHTRSEKYLDRSSRNPSTDYGTIKEDCMRRDLTINAIYCNVSTDEYIDVCGNSLMDIRHHIIRTPSDPEITYNDDPLRILRCVRFASRYGWAIEAKTYASMKNNIDRLSIISAERITDEFNKIIGNSDIDKSFHGLSYLNDIGAFRYIFTDVDINLSLMSSPLLSDIKKRIVVLLYESSNTNELLISRKYSNAFIRDILMLTRLSKQWGYMFDSLDCPIFESLCRQFQYDCGSEEVLNDVLDIIRVINPSLDEVIQTMPKGINHYGYKLPVNGGDIMKHFNIPSGPLIKQCLDYLINVSFSNPDISANECYEKIEPFIKL